MEKSVDQSADATAPWNGSIWFLGFVGLLAWQTWLSLGLFGPDAPWQTLVDDRPIISGAHPQHLYLGFPGRANRWPAVAARFASTIPSFQAGYPKTPIFNGSRIAEIILFLGGGTYNPAAYTRSVLACWS